MNRRDFLLFRTEGSARVAVLSCERLFIHYQDLNARFQQGTAEAGTLNQADWWAGEPALHIDSLDPDSFFRSLLRDLESVERIRISDMEWLRQGEFRARVETLLAGFKARGGEVTFTASLAGDQQQPPTAITSVTNK